VQAAYVLHQHDWSESSLILDLFTRESGRVAVAAKGAKRPYSQLRAVLLPLQRISVSLSKPAKADGGEVQTLRRAGSTGAWVGVTMLRSGSRPSSASSLSSKARSAGSPSARCASASA
jgi:DNA repair protein RecO (recombination protein O)